MFCLYICFMNRKCSPCYCITHRVRSLRWGCPPRKECGMSNIKFSNSSPRPFYERIIFVPLLSYYERTIWCWKMMKIFPLDQNTIWHFFILPPAHSVICSVLTSKAYHTISWINKSKTFIKSNWTMKKNHNHVWILAHFGKEIITLNHFSSIWGVRSEGPIRERKTDPNDDTLGREEIRLLENWRKHI